MAYSILFKQCGSDHMTRGRSRAIDRIVVHFTATLASARNNATYFARNEGQAPPRTTSSTTSRPRSTRAWRRAAPPGTRATGR